MPGPDISEVIQNKKEHIQRLEMILSYLSNPGDTVLVFSEDLSVEDQRRYAARGIFYYQIDLKEYGERYTQ